MQDSPATPGFSSAPKPPKRISQPLYCVPFTTVKPEPPDTANFTADFSCPLVMEPGPLLESYLHKLYCVGAFRGRKFPRLFSLINWKLSRVGSHLRDPPPLFHSTVGLSLPLSARALTPTLNSLAFFFTSNCTFCISFYPIRPFSLCNYITVVANYHMTKSILGCFEIFSANEITPIFFNFT